MPSKLERLASIYLNAIFKPNKAAGLLFADPSSKQIFLTRRSKTVDDPGVWSIAGGGVEKGESFLEAAKREAVEELGSMPEVQKIADETTFKDGDFTYKTFICLVAPSVRKAWHPKLNVENDKSEWFSLNDLPKDLHPGLKFTLKELKEKGAT